MSLDLTSNFFRLLLHFRRQDLVTFGDEHDRLYKEAKRTSDHSTVTSHYYSVMSAIIDDYFNGNFHFVPPQYDGQKLDEALVALHQNIAKCLKLEAGKKCIDIGCGIGTVMKDLASTGADLIGVTIASNEAHMGNKLFVEEGIQNCKIIEGDCHHMPFDNATFDAAYAIYAIKYFVELLPVMKEANRILKSNGLFVVYDLLKTPKYDETLVEHKKIIEGIEYACGMPSLHTREKLVAAAAECGLHLIDATDLDAITGYPFHYCFSSSPLFMWLIRSSIIGHLISAAQAVGILPKGFYQFNKIFLSGTVSKITQAGKMKILSGSEILLFQKKENH